MSAKLLPVPARLSPDVVGVLQQLCDERGISISEIIREGMNVYLSGDNSLAGVVNRMEKLEKNVSALVDILKSFAGKIDSRFDEALTTEKERIDEATAIEKERVLSILSFIQKELRKHDEAEIERFNRLDSSRQG